MQNLVFTQLSVSEIRQLLREELHAFFRDSRNVEALFRIANRSSTHKDNTYIEDLGMSVILYNGLKKMKVSTLGEMKSIEWKAFKKIHGIGAKSWDEMQDIISNIK